MTDLGTEDSGRYWCAVEINGGPDVRTGLFHLSVTPGKMSATLPYDHMTGVLVSFTCITMRNVGMSTFYSLTIISSL